ncbi:MAG: superoxide dismutase, partial [Myxococcaceae bacterium]
MAELAKKYTPKSFPHLKGLKGISDGVLESHFKLYEGYVNRTNKLTETLFGLAKEGQASGANPAYAEMTRRLGFEYNGMVLHEYYFGGMKPGGSGNPGAKLKAAAEGSFTSWDV